MTGLDRAAVTWHLHGHFDPPGGAEVLVRDAEGRARPVSTRAARRAGRS
jgi:hypothetical protein